MSKFNMIVCGLVAACLLITVHVSAAPQGVQVSRADSLFYVGSSTNLTSASNSVGVDWLNNWSGGKVLDATSNNTSNASMASIPSPGSAILLVAAAFIVGGGRRRPTSFVTARESRKFKVVTNNSTRREACMVRVGSASLNRGRNPIVAHA